MESSPKKRGGGETWDFNAPKAKITRHSEDEIPASIVVPENEPRVLKKSPFTMNRWMDEQPPTPKNGSRAKTRRYRQRRRQTWLTVTRGGGHRGANTPIKRFGMQIMGRIVTPYVRMCTYNAYLCIHRVGNT